MKSSSKSTSPKRAVKKTTTTSKSGTRSATHSRSASGGRTAPARAGTRTARVAAVLEPSPVEVPPPLLSPSEHYRLEKERRARGGGARAQALAEAQIAYEEMLKAQAAAQKGGRPKKTAKKPEIEDEELQ